MAGVAAQQRPVDVIVVFALVAFFVFVVVLIASVVFALVVVVLINCHVPRAVRFILVLLSRHRRLHRPRHP